MKSKIFLLTLTIVLFSCKEINKEESKNITKFEKVLKDSVVKTQDGLISDDVECNNKDTLQYQNDKISVYNDFKIKGEGVITLTIKDKVTFINDNNSIFGQIIMLEQSDYQFDTPKKIVARSIVPPFDLFSFDAELPSESDEFLRVYINGELKRIDKNQVNFTFEKWSDYVKKSFIKIRNCNGGRDLNTYKVTKMMNNLIEVQSISKDECDAVNYNSKTSKEIKWKNEQDVLLISFYSCN